MATMIDVNLDGLTYDGMKVEARILDGFVEVECNGYLYYRSHDCPTNLAEMVREGFTEYGERMDQDQVRDLAVWDEVESRISAAWAEAA